MNQTNQLSTQNTILSKREFWLRHIKKWEASGLRQQAYCIDVGISYASFVYWKGVLSAPPSQSKQKKFVPVKVTTNSAAAVTAPQAIQIKLLTGHIVYIPANMDMNEVGRLIHSLGVPHA